MLDFEVCTQLLHFFIIEVGPIISDDFFGNPVSTYNVVLQEANNHLLGDVGVRNKFDPFGEVVYGNQYK